MKDEFGRIMYSEKLLDMTFNNGKLIRMANQFGNGPLRPSRWRTANKANTPASPVLGMQPPLAQ